MMPTAMAGKPQKVLDGEYGHRINIGDENSYYFYEDEPTYVAYGWYYIEGERELYPMPIKLELYCDGIEIKLHRFTRKSDDEAALSPVYWFYCILDPFYFTPGEHFMEIKVNSHGSIVMELSHPIFVMDAGPM